MHILTRLILVALFWLSASECKSDDAVAPDTVFRFESGDGNSIEIAPLPGYLRVGSSTTVLHDCSNSSEFCMFNDHGFRFAFVKKCADWSLNKTSLQFDPLAVAVLDNRTWYIFKASPSFMFEYLWGEGVVGVYFDKKNHFDFSKLLNNEKSLARYDRFLFRKVPGDPFARCTW